MNCRCYYIGNSTCAREGGRLREPAARAHVSARQAGAGQQAAGQPRTTTKRAARRGTRHNRPQGERDRPQPTRQAEDRRPPAAALCVADNLRRGRSHQSPIATTELRDKEVPPSRADLSRQRDSPTDIGRVLNQPLKAGSREGGQGSRAERIARTMRGPVRHTTGPRNEAR